jgi:hypothetical protein
MRHGMKMSRAVVAGVVLGMGAWLLAGCASTAGPGPAVYASYAGDRATVYLDEIVAMMPKGTPDARDVRNAHICFGAIINPATPSPGNESGVRGIVMRASARIAAAVVEDIEAGNVPIEHRPGEARKRLVEKANQVFQAQYSQWIHAGDFRVELVVTSMFLTDGSVGKSSERRTFLW